MQCSCLIKLRNVTEVRPVSLVDLIHTVCVIPTVDCSTDRTYEFCELVNEFECSFFYKFLNVYKFKKKRIKIHLLVTLLISPGCFLFTKK